MSNTVIKVENLSKKYIIGHQAEGRRYVALRDVLADNTRSIVKKLLNPFGRGNGKPDATREEFWALRDVSFEINQGDRVGIIGRNGAGKSTLLKILSRITEPSSGKVRITGRVASLLEVGTGFHPELTGRENIYLNGAILGMSKAEIKKKFDEIVEFAEIEKFLDTPVKRYSSGMYVRLAFAVAAHLEPEILLVDEVLAVGDVQFQKKCLGKMENVSKEGRTILFVSHNMQAIKQLCNKGIVLNNGSAVFNGDIDKSVEEYLQFSNPLQEYSNLKLFIKSLPEDSVFRFTNIELIQEDNIVTELIENGTPLYINLEYEVFERTKGLRVFCDLCDTDEILLFRTFHDEDNDGLPTMEKGRYKSIAVIPANLLGPMTYTIYIHAGIHNVRYCLNNTAVKVRFTVEHTGLYNRAYMNDTFRGKIAPVIKWNTEKIE